MPIDSAGDSLAELSRLPLNDRCERLGRRLDGALAASVEASAFATTPVSKESAIRRLSWAVAFGVDGKTEDEAGSEPAGRKRVSCYRDRWPDDTSWDVVQGVLVGAPGDGEAADSLLTELARSVACEQRDDWQHPSCRPIDRPCAERAFARLYSRDDAKVIGFVRKSFGRRAGDPDSIAQEAWSRVFCEHWSREAFKRFLGLCRIATLVSQVSRFVAIDALRQQKSAQGQAVSLSDDPDRTCSERFGVVVDPARALSERELHLAIEQGLRRLSARQAVIAEMVWFRGMQAKDVADVLNITEAAVSQHLKKARDGVSELLRAQGFRC